jgi:fibronectin-binding autotransporter adhesin
MKSLKITKKLFVSLLLFGFFMCIHDGSAAAATRTWSGGGGANTSFFSAANWIGNVVPSTGDDIILPAPNSGSYTVTHDSVSDLGSITVLPGSNSGNSVNFVSTVDTSVFDDITVADHQRLNLTTTTAREIYAYSYIGGVGSVIKVDQSLQYFFDTISISNSVSVGAGTSPDDLPKVTFASISSQSSPSYDVTVNGAHVQFLGNNSGVNVGISATNSIIEASHTNALSDWAKALVFNNSQLRFSVAASNTITKAVTFNGNLFGKSSGLEGYEALYADNNTAPTLAGAVTLASDIAINANKGTPISFTGSIAGNYMLSTTASLDADHYLVINASPNGSKLPNGTYGMVISQAVYSDDKPGVDLYVQEGGTVTVNGKRRNVILEKNAVLKGSGTVGSITMKEGTRIAPGNSPGCLTAGNTTFTATSTFEVELADSTVCSEYDQLKVSGTVDLSGATLQTILLNDFKPTKGTVFTIIDNDGTDAVTGIFKDLAEGASVSVGGTVFAISYKGGDGNDVVLKTENVPGAPNTGVQLLTVNPLLLFTTTTISASILLILAKRYKSSL